MVFVVEKRTTKFLPTKQYRIVPGVWFRVPRPRNVFHELAKNSLLTKILPPEIYPLYGIRYFGAPLPNFTSSKVTYQHRAPGDELETFKYYSRIWIPLEVFGPT